MAGPRDNRGVGLVSRGPWSRTLAKFGGAGAFFQSARGRMCTIGRASWIDFGRPHARSQQLGSATGLRRRSWRTCSAPAVPPHFPLRSVPPPRLNDPPAAPLATRRGPCALMAACAPALPIRPAPRPILPGGPLDAVWAARASAPRPPAGTAPQRRKSAVGFRKKWPQKRPVKSGIPP
jgi:hypothetical protein